MKQRHLTDENSAAQHNTPARNEMKGIKIVVNEGIGRNSVINHTETWLRQRRKAPCDFYQAPLVLRSYASVTGNAAPQENGLGWQDQYSAWEGKGWAQLPKATAGLGLLDMTHCCPSGLGRMPEGSTPTDAMAVKFSLLVTAGTCGSQPITRDTVVTCCLCHTYPYPLHRGAFCHSHR